MMKIILRLNRKRENNVYKNEKQEQNFRLRQMEKMLFMIEKVRLRGVINYRREN